MLDALVTSTYTLTNSLNYLAKVIETRLLIHFDQSTPYDSIWDIPIPSLNGSEDLFTRTLNQWELSREDLLILLIAISPHIQPHFFDQIITKKLPQPGDFPQFGGVRGKQHRGFLPTGETVLFVLAGDDMSERFAIQQKMEDSILFSNKQILHIDQPEAGEPVTSGKLIISQDYIDLFTLGHIKKPQFSRTFPAHSITTELEWEDLVLNENTYSQIQELENWIKHSDTLMHEWGMKRKLKPGYRVLFHGPPGTGKTLTATLLGKYTNKDVYRIDLSMVVSKFIGETEKNLANLFNRAENKGWILFFDEADALFGKRTNVRDAHDKYANQEVAYLLQRIETYDGLVILASNFKSNIDDAFMRRFQSVTHFPLPKANERLLMWKKAFPTHVQLNDDLNLETIARKYELSGSNIMNVVQFSCLRAIHRGQQVILLDDLVDGIRKEFSKAGKLS